MYEFWIKAERFYTTIMPMILLILSVAMIVGLFMFYYTEKRSKKRKVMGISLILLFLGSAMFSFWGHDTYGFWLEQFNYINPGVRSQKKIMGTVIVENPSLVSNYQGVDLSDHYQSLEMYQREEVRQAINHPYLGELNGRHYFAIGKEEQYAFWYRGDVAFTQEKSYMQGTQFRLNDPRFEQLGFTPITPNYLETIYINQEEADQAKDEFPSKVLPFSSGISDWITGALTS
ncbi:hypothetical protein [Marinilactibacillus kalidii]|uniref:hypothetical protein n=1 Tax=Marinilactibacillus kalidii TaxID=2820274 RepID=UPI001ABDF41C|nr:hypothetical protein [Marinilactibacillus kalidii]